MGCAGARTHTEQHQERDSSAREELEEPAAGVLGVGEAVRDQYVVAASGEGNDLAADEGRVERAQAAKHKSSLDCAERWGGRQRE